MMKVALMLIMLFSTSSVFALYGARVQKSQEAFVVSLSLNDPLRGHHEEFCQGVLISPKTVITAGNCIDVTGLKYYNMSVALVYRPHLVSVKIGSKSIPASAVTIAPSYHEGLGLDAEDLALIELETPVTHVKPVKLASKEALRKASALSLVARGKKVGATKKSFTRFTNALGETHVVRIDSDAGTCRGDSGGAVLIHENGEPKLAGVLVNYGREEECLKESGLAYFPKAQF